MDLIAHSVEGKASSCQADLLILQAQDDLDVVVRGGPKDKGEVGWGRVDVDSHADLVQLKEQHHLCKVIEALLLPLPLHQMKVVAVGHLTDGYAVEA